MPTQPPNPLKPVAPIAPTKNMPVKATSKGAKLPVKKGSKTGQDFNFTGK